MLCLFWQLLPDVDYMNSFQLFKICIVILSRRCIHARVPWCEEMHCHLGDLACPPEVMGSRKGVRAQGLGLPCHLPAPGLVMHPGSADSWLPPPCAADHWRFHIKGRATQERGDKGSRMTSSTHIRGDEGWNKPEKVNQGFQHRSQFCAALGGEEPLWKSARGVPWAAVPTFAQWPEPNALEIQRRSKAA